MSKKKNVKFEQVKEWNQKLYVSKGSRRVWEGSTPIGLMRLMRNIATGTESVKIPQMTFFPKDNGPVNPHLINIKWEFMIRGKLHCC